MTVTTSAPPAVLEVRPDAIPAELKAERRWVGWRWEYRTPKWTKPPVNIHTGGGASSTDPMSWAFFDEAVAYARSHRLPGIGYNLDGSGLTGIDLDHCRVRDTGEIEGWAREIIDALPAYWEVSASGTGVHGLVRAVKPRGRCRTDKPHGIEIYEAGRYFTMTGQRLVL